MINNGYNLIKPTDSNDAMSNGFQYEHIAVAEKKLGRELKKGEVVHHLDENKQNNSPDNIIIFATNAEHTAFHKGNKEIYFDSDGIAHVDVGNKCLNCGCVIDKHAKLCRKCYLIKHHSSIPEKDELLNLLKIYSFVEIGKIFGVSERSVRKWCVSYNMPTQRKFYIE